MSVYVRCQVTELQQKNVVFEIINPLFDSDGLEYPIKERFTPEFVATLIDVTNISPQPQQGWIYDGGVFLPPS
ncbi:hypothetical protein [Caballeronia sp. INML2]|uniref:hypothetical protein n=1 Tax=Caballeronia sp. INML2 TaxID=2921748 RepID=UPI002028CDD8|nr:hypothetical protein [Caballeronia sp. INML2]